MQNMQSNPCFPTLSSTHFCYQDDPLEETGWKLVHGDVFRPPRYPTMLVVCLGSGIQILSMVIIIIGECVFVHECVCACVCVPLQI